MESSKSEYPKIIKGVVKQVHSADFITVRKTTKTSTTEHQYFLAGLQAPKMATNTWPDESFAFEAWELVWKKVIG